MAVAALAGVLAWPAASSGQQPGSRARPDSSPPTAPPGARAATAALAPDAALAPIEVATGHWVYPLLDRMAADGLLDGVWLPGRRPAGADAIGAALDTAAARAAGGSPWARTAAAAARWLRAEQVPGDGAALRVEALLGLRAGDGPRTDATAGLAGARLLAAPGPGWGLWAEPVVEAGASGMELPVPRLGAAWRTGNLRLAVSRGALRFEPGAGGGIVAGGGAMLTRVEAAMAAPARLPWLLRHVGPAQASLSVSRLSADTLGPAAAFVAGELRVQPHPRVTLGVYRSALAVWTVNGRHPGVRELAYMLIGKHTDFDDQKLALSAVVRADVLGVRLVPYAVWGAEDSAGLDEDPGVVLGAWAPGLPVAGAPLGVRYEYAAFGEAAQLWPWSDPFQVRNWYGPGTGDEYVNGDGELLGHPLGGYGSEHRVELDGAVPGAGLLLTAGLFHRDRDDPAGAPANLLYARLPGRSRGGYLDATVAAGRVRVEAQLVVEDGAEGWSRAEARLQGRIPLN